MDTGNLLSSFKSLCTTLFSCNHWTASTNCRNSLFTSASSTPSSLSFIRSTRSNSSPPGTYSSTRQRWCSVSIESLPKTLSRTPQRPAISRHGSRPSSSLADPHPSCDDSLVVPARALCYQVIGRRRAWGGLRAKERESRCWEARGGEVETKVEGRE
ncbi:hypothetical protein BC937DRAFT_94830 [Endogone sp. FLAS-F59071]|nr:hypothetical protein BC937DRAFT_94830 [Endogone sp. FLAS-F59071]|eukprot:RUS13756.1 hypothetical protein BC937DRAFT_94830 [Endogone sp. FLAS-F59071]